MLVILCLNPEREAEYNERLVENHISEGHVRTPLVGFEDARGTAGARTKSAMRRSAAAHADYDFGKSALEA